jgi:flagellar biosynthesis protein FlhF
METEVKTYRASSMQEALTMVRRDLGAGASVLHTREVRSSRLFGLLGSSRRIEVTASAEVHVPSQLPTSEKVPTEPTTTETSPPPLLSPSFRKPQIRFPESLDLKNDLESFDRFRPDSNRSPEWNGPLQDQLANLRKMTKGLCDSGTNHHKRNLPDSFFKLYTDLIEVDVNEHLASELIERIRQETPSDEQADPILIRARLLSLLESEIPVAGPISITPGRHRLVALVGPTGVGKTTTIAKLAANYRLKQRKNVGLITVDTYRIAAVEQLRTYADIIDLPMQVVSTPREMREAVQRLSGLDLILMDTAGRSPRDEIKIQELKSFLSEAGADEVHLVLSSVAGERTLQQTAERFATVGTTSLILTKLDEATDLGNILPLLSSKKLPISYLTNGQNVPDDIQTADAGRLAKTILMPETAAQPSI